MNWRTLDLQVFRWVNQAHAWWLDWPLAAVGWLGELGALWVVITLILWWKRSRWAPYFTYLLLGTVFLNDLIIHSFTDRTRPYIALDSVRLLGWPWNSSSFVSGHAVLTVSVAVFVSHAFPQWRRSIWVFALLTLYGRVYAGIHFPTDVLSGALIGLALGLSAVAAERRDLWKHMVAWTSVRWTKWKAPFVRVWDQPVQRFIVLGVLSLSVFVATLLWLSWFGVWLTLVLVLANVSLIFLGRAVLGAVSRRRPQRRTIARVAGIILAVFLVAESVFVYSYIWRYAIDRDPLPNDRYVVLVVADGASLEKAKEIFLEGVDGGDYMKAANENYPMIARYFIREGAYTANGVSAWPSSSIPAHTAIITGSYPRHTDVVGQRQFSRAERKHTSYIGLGIFQQRNILRKERKTLYEFFPDSRSLVVLQVVNRGCSFFLPCSPSDHLAVQRISQVFGVSRVLGRLSGRTEMPRLLIVTLPDVDHLTHSQPMSGEKTKALYRDLERSVAAIMDLYRREGLYDKTLFVLAADHGMGEVDKHVTLDNLVHDLRFDSFASLKWSANPAWGSFEANTFVGLRYRFEHINNAVPLWGGNSDGALYIKGQKLDANGNVLRESWDIKPSEESLHNYVVGGVRVDVIRRLLEYSPGIGLIFTNPAPGVFRIYGQNGLGLLEERNQGKGLEFRYTLLEGEDPLGIRHPSAREAIRRGEWQTDARWLDHLYLEHNPDAFRRVSHSFGSNNSADLHIVAADGWDFTPYYASPHVLVGSHGSLNRDQSCVPIMFHGPEIEPVEMPYARTVDILPTILAYLGRDVRDLPLDGHVLPVFRGAPALPYDMGEPVSANGTRYKLAGLYGSYDCQLMVEREEGWSVGIPSLRAYLVADKVNVTFEGLEARGIGPNRHLVVLKRYVAEDRAPAEIRFHPPPVGPLP